VTKSTTFSCPVCHQPLSLKKPAEFVIIFCSHGPCPSKAANDGAIGGTELAAFEALKRLIDAEDPTTWPNGTLHFAA